MTATARILDTTEEQYSFIELLQIEAKTGVRHEFYFGQITAMAGGTKRHNLLGKNIARLLEANFEQKGCQIYTSDIKLEAIRGKYYPYPDVILSCDKSDTENDLDLLVKNPSVIVEVLSNSTEENDKGQKLEIYKNIPTLKYYLLVSQYEHKVEVYFRQINDGWGLKIYRKLEDQISLKNIDFEMSLSAIYRGIQLEVKPDLD
jgi:Uma2 family endonuclease